MGRGDDQMATPARVDHQLEGTRVHASEGRGRNVEVISSKYTLIKILVKYS